MTTTTGRIPRTEEEQRKRPLNRLQTVYALRAQQDIDYKNMQQSTKEEGKPVVWSGADSFYRHVYKAMNINDIYGDQYGPVVSAAGLAPFFIDRCVAEGFPNHMCGYYLCMIGYAIRLRELGGRIPPEAPPGREIPKPDLVVATLTVCDTHAKGMQAVSQYLDTAYWIGDDTRGRDQSRFALRKEHYEATVKMLVAELKEYIAFLERLLGKKMDWDAFEEDIEANGEVQSIWDWISREARKVRPCPVNIRDQLTGITGRLFKTPDPAKTIEIFKNMHDEVQYRIDNKIAGINRPEKYRVGLASIPPWHGLGIFEQLADRGWNFVSGGYGSVRPLDVSWVKDPVERAIRYHRRFIGDEIDLEFEPEEAARIKEQISQQGYSPEYAVHSAKVYREDGAFIHPLRTCRGGGATALLRQHEYMEAYKVPCIIIPGDHIDPRFWDPDDAMKKFIAFEETMDYYKEVRKKAGFEW